MILWLAAALAAPSTEVQMLAGARTAPEATVEQPSEWEGGSRPAGVIASIGRVAWRGKSTWGGVGGAAWGTFPESNTSLLSMTPRGGIEVREGALSASTGATYDLRWFPGQVTSSSGRLEVLAEVGAHPGTSTLRAGATAIDRRYPRQKEWSFSTIEPEVGAETTWRDVRLGLASSMQWNRGRTVDAAGASALATGSQVRGRAELGLSKPLWALEFSYRPIVAFEGQSEDAARPQFTPVGAYADDADALSAGGFVQHRVNVSMGVTPGPWTVRVGGLGRFRVSSEAAASFGRTVHGDVMIERKASDHLAVFGRVGTSAVQLANGPSYVDSQAWLGLRWSWGP